MPGRLRPALILIAILLMIFVALGSAMLAGALDGFDRALVLGLRAPGDLGDPLGSHGVEEAVRDLTALGGTTLVALVTAGVALVLLAQGQRRKAAVLIVVILLAWFTKDTAKALYDRARPDLVPHEVFVSSASFPSGHTTLATALYLMLAVLASPSGLSPRGRAVVFGLAVLLAGLVGFSRVYLGVHWPSDVLAGWCLGAMWAVVGWAVLAVSAKPAEVR